MKIIHEVILGINGLEVSPEEAEATAEENLAHLHYITRWNEAESISYADRDGDGTYIAVSRLALEGVYPLEGDLLLGMVRVWKERVMDLFESEHFYFDYSSFVEMEPTPTNDEGLKAYLDERPFQNGYVIGITHNPSDG